MTNPDFFLFFFRSVSCRLMPCLLAFSMCCFHLSPVPLVGALSASCFPFLPAPLGYGWTVYNARLQSLRQNGSSRPSLHRLRSASLSSGFLCVLGSSRPLL